MKRLLIAASLGLVALSACHRDSEKAAETAAAQAPVVTDARLVLPAVAGRPGALYFTAANPGNAPLRLTGIAVAGTGKAEMHETVGGAMKPLPQLDIAAGDVARFEPGARHVMVFDIAPATRAGGTIEATFRFGDRAVTAPARVQAAGDAMADAPAMDMSHMDMPHPDHAH
ncbi:MAG: copper chaperone PCu(A)C [Sphingomonadales bacterium]|nr:copper chaperone PCu(A)C [Sphingomonadales bacterium]